MAHARQRWNQKLRLRHDRPAATGPEGQPALLAKLHLRPCPGGMCGYNIGESTVSLTLVDNPVGYTPPLGPSAKVQITYNQREDSQPQVFNFFNISPKWTLNWLSYVTDDPNNPGANVTRYLPGGGAYYYTGYNSATGQFAAQNNDGSILVLASQNPITYRRQLADGGVEIYAQSDGAANYPRNIFLSQIIDPQGNTLTLNYDSEMRLVSLTDAVGRQTTFSYGLAANPLLITEITDPFGRSATLTYDADGRLSAITDVLGLTSSFAYDANSLVDAMTTPYGTTNFAYVAPGAACASGLSICRFVQATDPLGYNEREEWIEPAPVASSDPSSTVPPSPPMPLTPTNDYLEYRDSFHWDKNAYVVAGCGGGPPPAGCNYADARDRHFNHDAADTSLKSTSIESVKYALENRIWFQYPGQTNPILSGSYEKPAAVGRVLDDGTTQASQFSYDTANYFELTQAIDPVGRTTSFTYAANAIDLTQIAQTVAGGTQATIAQFAYTGANCTVPHRVCSDIDAAGETTTYTYNAAGQLTSVTNPLNQTTSFQYAPAGDLTTIVNADNQTAASFTYDAFDRIRTYTDADGWTVAYGYDAADRITRIAYPDGSADLYTWDKLDLAAYRDRLGRTWTYAHDADRRLTAVTDPLGNETQFGYDTDGRLTSLTDPKNNTTRWAYDVEERLISKTYPDNSTLAYTYENTMSRLHSLVDALGQTKQYDYAEDNRLTGVTYQNAVNPTANVSFAYDPYFPRLVSMTDGTGTTQYTYVPVGSLGALRLQQETPPLANSAIAYAYDALGRLASRTVAGQGAESFGYDAIGRLVNHTSDLGAFTLAYLGETGQVTSRSLPSPSTLATTWSYLPNSGDRRLAGIANTGLTSSQYTNFTFTSMPENLISGVSTSSDATPAYPSTGTQTASYNNLNQLTNLSGQALTWDADGNLLSDGTRNYSWDAENRLVAITYPGQPGTQTSFAYDGLGRRTAITGVSGTTTSHLWCGSRICQARNASGAVTREYFAEGEYVPGSPAQPYYYGVDQLGSVRRVYASTTNASAYDYDAYGNPLQTTAPLTDFTYAGLFYNADNGLDLASYRAYDPVSGRWLSRDPLGEGSDPVGNLYRYVGGNPVSMIDPRGEFWPELIGVGIIGILNVAWYEYLSQPPPAPPQPQKICTRGNPQGWPGPVITNSSPESSPVPQTPMPEPPEPPEWPAE
jgi:RHS repeat-associated protein